MELDTVYKGQSTDIVYKCNFQGFITPYICYEKVQTNVLVIITVLVLVLVLLCLILSLSFLFYWQLGSSSRSRSGTL